VKKGRSWGFIEPGRQRVILGHVHDSRKSDFGPTATEPIEKHRINIENPRENVKRVVRIDRDAYTEYEIHHFAAAATGLPEKNGWFSI